MTTKEFYKIQKKIAKTHKHISMNSYMLCDECWFVGEYEERNKHKKTNK